MLSFIYFYYPSILFHICFIFKYTPCVCTHLLQTHIPTNMCIRLFRVKSLPACVLACVASTEHLFHFRDSVDLKLIKPLPALSVLSVILKSTYIS